MLRYFCVWIGILLAVSVFAESTEVSGLHINRRMMEDKTMVGIQGNFMTPLGAYAKDVNSALGGGLRGKYFGTNTFAFAFDIGFFTPKIKPERILSTTETLQNTLREEQRIGNINDTSARISSINTHSQYIPFNLSFEFYLPSQALNNFRPYAGIGIGLNMINRRYDVTYNMNKTSELLLFEERYQPSTNRGFVGINPSIGFLWTLDELWNINMDLRYNYLLGEQKGGTFMFNVGVIWDLSFKYVR